MRRREREEYEEAEEEKDSSAVLENRNSHVDTPLQIVRVMTPPRFKSHASHGAASRYSLCLSEKKKPLAERRCLDEEARRRKRAGWSDRYKSPFLSRERRFRIRISLFLSLDLLNRDLFSSIFIAARNDDDAIVYIILMIIFKFNFVRLFISIFLARFSRDSEGMILFAE